MSVGFCPVPGGGQYKLVEYSFLLTKIPVNPLARTGPARPDPLVDRYRAELAGIERFLADDRLRDALVSEATRKHMAEFHRRQAEEAEEERLQRERMLGP